MCICAANVLHVTDKPLWWTAASPRTRQWFWKAAASQLYLYSWQKLRQCTIVSGCIPLNHLISNNTNPKARWIFSSRQCLKGSYWLTRGQCHDKNRCKLGSTCMMTVRPQTCLTGGQHKLYCHYSNTAAVQYTVVHRVVGLKTGCSAATVQVFANYNC